MAKIAVVGCGAMGSVYAALMVDAGHEVHAVTLWPDHAEAMATKGLRCEGASGDRTVPIHASTTTDGIGPCDLVIIATKAFDVEEAARSCISLLGPETIVQTIQNGLGSPEIAAPILGADRLAVGVVGGFGASIRAPGHAHHNGMEMIRFGAFAGLPKQLLQASAKIWESSGFKVALFDDIKQMVWEKLIMNVAFSGTSCTTGLTIGEILIDADAWSVARGCAEEAVAVAKASKRRRLERQRASPCPNSPAADRPMPVRNAGTSTMVTCSPVRSRSAAATRMTKIHGSGAAVSIQAPIRANISPTPPQPLMPAQLVADFTCHFRVGAIASCYLAQMAPLLDRPTTLLTTYNLSRRLRLWWCGVHLGAFR